MTVRSSIWIGDKKHDYSMSEYEKNGDVEYNGIMEYEKREDCSIKARLQRMKSQGRKPTDSWLLKNPEYAEYWDKL